MNNELYKLTGKLYDLVEKQRFQVAIATACSLVQSSLDKTQKLKNKDDKFDSEIVCFSGVKNIIHNVPHITQ